MKKQTKLQATLVTALSVGATRVARPFSVVAGGRKEAPGT